MAQSVNTTNATAMTVRVAGLSAYATGPPGHVLGRQRAVDVSHTISTTTAVPIMTVYDKTIYAGANNYTSIVLQSLSVSSDGTKGSVIVQIIDSPTLTGTSYADISTNTSACQLDTSATSVTTSTAAVVYSVTINCTGSAVFDLAPFNIHIAPGQWVTLAARCSAAGTSNGVTAALTFKEEC